jgi:hypothetical protein
VPALEIAHEARPLVRYIRFHPRHLLGVNDPVGLVSTINPVYTPARLTIPIALRRRRHAVQSNRVYPH